MHCLDAGREILLGQRRFHDAQMQVLEKRQAEDEIAEVIPAMSERYGDLRVFVSWRLCQDFESGDKERRGSNSKNTLSLA